MIGFTGGVSVGMARGASERPSDDHRHEPERITERRIIRCPEDRLAYDHHEITSPPVPVTVIEPCRDGSIRHLVLCLLNNLWSGAALSAHISERLRGFCASTRPANAPRPL